MATFDDWMAAYRQSNGKAAAMSTNCRVPPELVFAFADGVEARWRTLVGCQVRRLGKGFGEVVRVEGSTLWVRLNSKPEVQGLECDDLENVNVSKLEGSRITGILFPSGFSHVLVHTALIAHGEVAPGESTRGAIGLWEKSPAAIPPPKEKEVNNVMSPITPSSTASVASDGIKEYQYARAEVIFEWAGNDFSQWQKLVGCRIRVPGRGFGEVVRVDGLTLWVKFDAETGVGNTDAFKPEAVKASSFQDGTVAGVIYPPSSTLYLDVALERKKAVVRKKEATLERKPLTTPLPKQPTKPQPTSLSNRSVACRPSLPAPRKAEMQPAQLAPPTVTKPAATIVAPLESRAPAIKAFCQEHGIKWLTHFSRVENLEHILEHGLVSRIQVDEWRRQNGRKFPLVCDEERWDQQRSAICLSISFPNYLVFQAQQMKYGGEWVVLQLDAAILWELECAFCPTNAAHSSVFNSPLHERMSVKALEALFLDRPQIVRDSLKIPSHYPTDPQAEVLVLEAIPTKYIQILHLQSELARPKWEEILAERGCSGISLRVANSYFRPRHDHIHWKKVEFGLMPEQTPLLSNDQ